MNCRIPPNLERPALPLDPPTEFGILETSEETISVSNSPAVVDWQLGTIRLRLNELHRKHAKRLLRVLGIVDRYAIMSSQQSPHPALACIPNGHFRSVSIL